METILYVAKWYLIAIGRLCHIATAIFIITLLLAPEKHSNNK